MKIPAIPADIDVDWMNQVLADRLNGNRVAGVSADYLTTPGQTADVVGVQVHYMNPTDLPTAFVAKISTRDQATMDQVVRPMDLYAREYSFYRAGIEGVNYPACFHSDFDAASQAMVLLLDDVSHLDCPSWAASPAQIEIAVDRLAPFHARWWNHEKLDGYDWLVDISDKMFLGMFAEISNAAIPVVSELVDGDMSLGNELIAAFRENLDGVIAWGKDRPVTFAHGDYHPKQMFFGTADSVEDIVVIDWQAAGRASPGNDLARIIVLGLDRDTRRAREHELIGRYHEGLKANGIDYPLDALMEDYRMGIFISLAIAYLAAVTDLEPLKAELTDLGLDWREVFFYRLVEALEDHQGGELIAQWQSF